MGDHNRNQKATVHNGETQPSAHAVSRGTTDTLQSVPPVTGPVPTDNTAAERKRQNSDSIGCNVTTSATPVTVLLKDGKPNSREEIHPENVRKENQTDQLKKNCDDIDHTVSSDHDKSTSEGNSYVKSDSFVNNIDKECCKYSKCESFVKIDAKGNDDVNVCCHSDDSDNTQSNGESVKQTNGQGADGQVTDPEKETKHCIYENHTSNPDLETYVICDNMGGKMSCRSGKTKSHKRNKAKLQHIESQPMLQNNPPSHKSTARAVDLPEHRAVDLPEHRVVDLPEHRAVYLPEHMINLLKCHWQMLESPGIEIRERKDGTEFLHVTSEGFCFERVNHPIFSELSKLCSLQTLLEAARFSYLDSSEGHEATETIEQRNKCVVRTHPPSILLRATSPWGHSVCVCEGSIAHRDCQILVLLLHEDQETWSPQIRHILQKERLPHDVSKDVEPAPKERIKIDYCSTNRSQKVVMIYAPSRIDDKEVHNIQEALTKVMRKAAKEARRIAVHFDWIIEQKRKASLKVILQSIVETFNEKVPACLLKLYLEEGHADKFKLCEVISKFLSRWKSSGACDFARDRSIKMIVADILNEEADVLVNSASKNLDLKRGMLSKVLLETAGPELAQQCKERYPEGLTDRVVAVTDCFQLKTFTNIFHIFLPPWPQKTMDQTERAIHHRLERIRTCIQTCLALASAMNYRSIVFPTLGMGTLGYPAKQVAETMFTTFREFFLEMPHSSLSEVTVVCFHADVTGFQNFRMVETRFALQQNADSISGCNFHQVVAEVEKLLSEASNLKFVTLVVPSNEDLSNVGAAFRKAKKWHVPDEGGKSMASNDASFRSLTVCGTLSSVRKAREEIQALPIPDEFQTRKPPQEVKSESGVDGPQKRGRGSIPGQTKGAEEAAKKPRTLGVHPEVPLSSSSKEGAWSKEVDVLEKEALQFLLREKFMDNFISREEAGDKVLIEAMMANPPEEIIRKMDEIRREDMEIESQHTGLTFDTESEGIEAYIRVLPDQSGVALFCFDYSTMTTAKHFVNVKTGRIRITSRRNRRFDDGRGSRQMADKAPETGRILQQQTSMVDLTTPVTRIRVSVYKTDITKLPVDAIVNAANEHLAHGGGVAYAIARAAGFTLESEGDDYVKQHGPLKVAQVIVTTGGNLPCKKVLHAVGPRWADYPNKSQCCQALTDTVFNCLSLASHSGFTSLAVASISSAIFGVPQQTCAECYLAAVQRFDDECCGKTSLSHIHFVDVNDTMVSVIQDTFRSSWDRVQKLGCPVPPSAGDGAVNEPARSRRRQRQQQQQEA